MFQRDLVILRWTAGLFVLALWATPVAAQTGDSAPTDLPAAAAEMDRIDEVDEVDEVDDVDEINDIDEIDEAAEMDRMEQVDRIDRIDQGDPSLGIEFTGAAPLPVDADSPARGEASDSAPAVVSESGQSPTRNVRLVDAIVASVDGAPVTYLDLQRFLTGRGLLSPGADRLTEADFLDVLVEERLFAVEFELNGITVDDEDTQAYVDQILENNNSDRAAVEKALAEIGLSWDDYFSRMRFEVQKLALINREIRTRVNVTDEEVERHWKKAPEYQLRPRVEISHIYIPLPANGNALQTGVAKQQAEDAHKMANKSGFAKAAVEHSEGPTAADGGKLGAFEQGTLAPHFQEQILLLEDGEHSEPFAAVGAIHIIRVDERVSEGRVELVEVQEEIRGKLYNEMLDVRFQRWLNEDLYERHLVTKHLEDLDDLVSSPSPSSVGAAGAPS